ncbi:MAG: DUF2207 domain-containing protein [Balneolaceae bacterium]|nr:DUF2207 domain-containing protein [Balneolaceae bacterium]
MLTSRLWGFLLLITTVLFLAPYLQAKEYAIPDIRVEVSITEDGTVQITEHRTYVFDGSFSWADYRLPLQGFTDIRNIRVSEGNESYINENSEFPGSFSVATSDDVIQVKWHFRAEDETRTFTVSYELEGALVVGPEWSEFFWNYMAAGREKSTENLDITLTLPRSVESHQLYAWTRGTGENISISKQDGTYMLGASDISRSESVQVRTVFPSSVFSEQVTVNDDDFSLQQAQLQEQNYRQERAKQLEQEAFYNEIAKAATILIIVMSIWCFYYYYKKYGSRFEVRGVSTRETIVIPGKEAPAMVAWLLYNRNITGNALVATLLDLARRGYFEIHEQEAEDGWFSSGKPKFTIERTDKDPAGGFFPWEREVLHKAEQRIAEGEDTMKKLFSGNDTDVARWFRKWKKDLHEFCMNQGWIDRESYTGAKWNAGWQLALGFAGIGAAVLGGPIAIAGAVTAFAFAVGSMAIIRRTEKGERKYAQWKAYQEGLKNIEQYTYDLDLLDRHFIYGTALHLSSKELETLFASSGRNTSHMLPWIVLMPGSSHTPADMASAFSTLAATGTSSSAGTSGGGGASAGSAGGGASGGAG